MRSNAPFPNPDWWERNESNGQEFYGYDSDDGTTAWYTPDGCLDWVTPKPYKYGLDTEMRICSGTLERF